MGQGRLGSSPGSTTSVGLCSRPLPPACTEEWGQTPVVFLELLCCPLVDTGCPHLLACNFCCVWSPYLVPRAGLSACDDIDTSGMYTGEHFHKCSSSSILTSALSLELFYLHLEAQMRKMRPGRDRTAPQSPSKSRGPELKSLGGLALWDRGGE